MILLARKLKFNTAVLAKCHMSAHALTREFPFIAIYFNLHSSHLGTPYDIPGRIPVRFVNYCNFNLKYRNLQLPQNNAPCPKLNKPMTAEHPQILTTRSSFSDLLAVRRRECAKSLDS